jgi:hypothetical protein
MPERIYLPCVFLQSNIAIFLATPKIPDTIEKPDGSSLVFKLGALYLSLILLFTVFLVHLEYGQNRDWTFRANDLKTTVRNLKPKDNQLFITWGSAFPYEKVDAFDVDFLKHFHTISLAWFQRTPVTEAEMSRFGLKNLSRDLVDNPKVFVICNQKQFDFFYYYMISKYKMKTYGQSVFRSNAFNVYAIRRVKQRGPFSKKQRNIRF